MLSVPVDAGPKVIPAFTEKVKVLAFTEDDKNGFFAGTDNGLYRSYDIDKGWEKLSVSLRESTTAERLEWKEKPTGFQ